MGSKSVLLSLGISVAMIVNCANPAPKPPDQFMVIRTFYKTAAGADLLDSSKANSFKKDDIKIISEVEIKGIVQEMNYYEAQGLGIFVDGDQWEIVVIKHLVRSILFLSRLPTHMKIFYFQT